MKKETLEFINGDRNAVKDEFILGREMAGSSEFILVSVPERERPLYALWNSRKNTKKYKIRNEEKDNEEEEFIFEKVVPKGTGGEMSYVMLMVYGINELNRSHITVDAAGALFKLIDSIEWNTGRVFRRSDNKSMSSDMMLNKLGVCRGKLKRILRELRGLNVVSYDNRRKAYYVNSKYIRKGAAVDED